jgi:exopolysaccharide biosynthesis operon protein EpsL
MVVRLVLHRTWLVPTLCLGVAGAAWAQQAEPGLQLRASAALMQDSNLFRLSDSANVKASTGKDSAAETVGVTTLGLTYNKAYSLQRIELDVSLVDYRYQNFDYLSFTARNYAAAWRWSLTPRLHGNLTSNRKESLNNYSDYVGSSLRTQRNLRTDTSNGFDAVYEITGAGRLLGGVSQAKQVNEQALVADSDYSISSANLGARYEFASGSSITYKATASNGKYLNRSLSQSSLVDDGFDQTESDLRLHWVVSGKLTADINAGFVERTHPHFAQRNFSGPQAGASLNWAISGKTSLSAELSRRLGAYQTSYSNYSQTDKFSVGPSWQLSAKTALSLRYDISHIDYLDAPTGTSQTSRQDTVRDTTLSLAWQPRQSATLNASISNATRSSTLPGIDYQSRTATFSASYNF